MNSAIPAPYNRLEAVLLLAVLGVATLLRFIGIADHSLSGDEITTIDFAALSLAEIANEIRIWENHPPLYYWIMHFVVDLFGVSEYSIRIPSTIFGIAAVYYTFVLARMLFGTASALVVAALLAVSPFAVTYSQDGRMYTLLLLFSVISSVRFVIWTREMTLRNMVFYWVPSVLLVYTHVYGILFVFGQTVFMAFYVWSQDTSTRWPMIRTWVTGQFLLVVASLPWLLVLAIRAMDHQEDGFWIGVPTLRTVINILFDYTGSRETAALWVLLLGTAVFSVFQSRDKSGEFAFTRFWAVAFCIVTIGIVHVIPFLMSQVSTPVYLHKYTLPAMPGFYMLGILGVSLLHRVPAKVLACLILLAGMVPGYTGSDRMFAYSPALSDAAKFLKANAAAEEGVVLCGRKNFLMTIPHYLEREQIESPVVMAWTKRVRRSDPESILRPVVAAPPPVPEQIRHLDKVWYLHLDDVGGIGCERPQDWVGEDFEIVDRNSSIYRIPATRLERRSVP